VAVLLSIAAIAAAGCGSSSSSKSKPASPSASTPATPSTPSTGTSTTAASGPLTKASLTAAQQSYNPAFGAWSAAVNGNHNGKAIAAATAKLVTALQSYIAQVSALKAPSAAAAAAQQKFVSALKQGAAGLEQLRKAASANDQTALTAAEQQIKANGAPVNAARKELVAALPS
jgi:hypothetical protein